MTDKIAQFPTPQLQARQRVDQIVKDLVEAHEHGEVEHLIVMYWKKDDTIWSGISGDLQIRDFSHACAIFKHRLYDWISQLRE